MPSKFILSSATTLQTIGLHTHMLCTWMESMKKSPLCAVPRGSAGLSRAVAVGVCVVVAARIGIVGDAVGTVQGVVVGRTSVADNGDGDDDDQE